MTKYLLLAPVAYPLLCLLALFCHTMQSWKRDVPTHAQPFNVFLYRLEMTMWAYCPGVFRMSMCACALAVGRLASGVPL